MNVSAIPELQADPVIRLLVSGKAHTLEEAEEMYLDSSIPDLLALIASPLSNEELSKHPLIDLLLSHGSRGWEDSLERGCFEAHVVSPPAAAFE